MRRSDTTKMEYLRSHERFLRDREGQWYFQTREGDRGPFNSWELAKLELERFTDTMEYIEENEESLPSEVDWGDVTVVEIENTNCYSG